MKRLSVAAEDAFLPSVKSKFMVHKSPGSQDDSRWSKEEEKGSHALNHICWMCSWINSLALVSVCVGLWLHRDENSTGTGATVSTSMSTWGSDTDFVVSVGICSFRADTYLHALLQHRHNNTSAPTTYATSEQIQWGPVKSTIWTVIHIVVQSRLTVSYDIVKWWWALQQKPNQPCFICSVTKNPPRPTI